MNKKAEWELFATKVRRQDQTMNIIQGIRRY